jgi:hypothetical protein
MCSRFSPFVIQPYRYGIFYYICKALQPISRIQTHIIIAEDLTERVFFMIIFVGFRLLNIDIIFSRVKASLTLYNIISRILMQKMLCPGFISNILRF